MRAEVARPGGLTDRSHGRKVSAKSMSEAKILSSRIVYKGGHIQVREDRVIEPAGHEASREIVVHPGAVCIVARPTPEDVILVRQYRHAPSRELLEIPAGALDEGEDHR